MKKGNVFEENYRITRKIIEETDREFFNKIVLKEVNKLAVKFKKETGISVRIQWIENKNLIIRISSQGKVIIKEYRCIIKAKIKIVGIVKVRLIKDKERKLKDIEVETEYT